MVTSNNIIRRTLLLGASLLSFSFATSLASAETYPSRPIRVIVPLAAASTVDIVARALGEELATTMGQQFVIDNRPGAGGVIGTGEMIRAEKDGYTIGMTSSNHVISPFIIKSISFDSLKDITPITVVGTVPLVLVTHPSLPVRTAGDLIALAKEKPGALDYGSAGNGSALHLAGVLFTTEAGVDMRHVPYRGTGPLTNDLIAGHVKIGFLSATAALPQIQSGTLRAIAVSTPTRIEALPDVPTLAESGLKDYSFDAWIAMIAPAGLPKPLVDRLYSETRTVLATQKMKDAFASQGVTIIGSDPATAEKFFESELAKHEKLVAAAGATTD
ncbi:Bug family tripartite tricarboxylate transporter substrate binding protein [Microvirga massiliensis]|uniref:Bug family tripartite tricarboxylate transporter substrate binding protein n=1 Tax=Microvirga massiliensis TaxID=1033741 RepID=UPI00069AC900|nr:tripartite tricarboxylate transporter substrate binding protein [Microvirga massiliensis]